MRIIGVTGGVSSGKSTVAGMFERLGAAVLDADRAGHEALHLPNVKRAAKRRWGEKIFGPDGRIDRARLARIVFAPGVEAERERNYLEQLTHPEIARLLRRQAESMAAEGAESAVLDAPLLLEAGWDEMCEIVVFVDAPRETRLARALARGWNKEDFEAREDAQEPLQRKRERADVIIDNSGPTERTQARVERVWASLVG